MMTPGSCSKSRVTVCRDRPINAASVKGRQDRLNAQVVGRWAKSRTRRAQQAPKQPLTEKSHSKMPSRMAINLLIFLAYMARPERFELPTY